MSIAFIGAGNMAGSLINGLLESGTAPSDIAAADPMATQLEKLAALGVITAANNDQAIESADVIVLAVKPQVTGDVLEALSGLKPNQLIISIVAGIDLRSLETWLPDNQPIVRCMPNTPALLGAGMTGLFANSKVADQQKASATHILKAVGEVAWVNEGSAFRCCDCGFRQRTCLLFLTHGKYDRRRPETWARCAVKPQAHRTNCIRRCSYGAKERGRPGYFTQKRYLTRWHY